MPIGSYKRPKLFDEELLLKISAVLENVTILSGDYERTIEFIPKDLPCLFYLDPPYRPISKTASFNSYSNEVFCDSEQIRLAQFCKKIDKMGHQFLLSNSDPKNHDSQDDFFDALYHEFCIERVKANRSISAKATGRQIINEIMIRNY